MNENKKLTINITKCYRKHPPTTSNCEWNRNKNSLKRKYTYNKPYEDNTVEWKDESEGRYNV